jgi:hypothetical protein
VVLLGFGEAALGEAEAGLLVQPVTEEGGGIEQPGHRDRLGEEPVGLVVVPVGGGGGGHARDLIGDACPVPKFDGDPQRLDKALGGPNGVALLLVDRPQVADDDTGGRPVPSIVWSTANSSNPSSAMSGFAIVPSSSSSPSAS